MPRNTAKDHTESYRQASERLIVLLSSSRHQIDILESKQKRYERPLHAMIQLIKSIDLAILDFFGLSPRLLAHIVPPEQTKIDEASVGTMTAEELQQTALAYDARFAVAERRARLHAPRQSIGTAYRFMRGQGIRLAKRLVKILRRGKQS